MSIAPQEGRTIAPDGTPLAWRLEGAGPSMLIMNGLVSTALPHWRAWLGHYPQRFRVLTWDYRGHGLSPLPDRLDTVTIEQCADDAASVAAGAGLPRPVVVCGLSMGVQSALEFYRRHPTEVRALVLLCGTAGHALNRLHPSPHLRRTVASIVRNLERVPRLVTGVLTPLAATRLGAELAYVTGGASRAHLAPDVMPEVFRHAADLDPAVFSRITASYLEHSAEDMLGTIAVPTLILAGDRDDLTPVSAAEAMHRQIRGSELHIVRGHSHLAQLEKPDEVHGVVDAFLAKHALG